MVYISGGRVADIGVHEVLVSKHKSYANLLSLKDDDNSVNVENRSHQGHIMNKTAKTSEARRSPLPITSVCKLELETQTNLLPPEGEKMDYDLKCSKSSTQKHYSTKEATLSNSLLRFIKVCRTNSIYKVEYIYIYI